MRQTHSHTDNAHAPAREVHIALEARPTHWAIAKGATVHGWSYNGRIPGPVIDARVGDVLVVRLTNSLPEPTTIHWHGLRIPAVMDGTEVVQHAVAPGDMFEYRFTLPDAGTFWFHPHTNETVQLERGLHGVLVVRGPDDDQVVVDQERVLVLDDVLLDGDGDFAPFGDRLRWHEGRDGNVLLLNGRADATLTLAAGQVERWRIVNVANSRYMRLSLGGRPFRLIGTDGGLIPAPVTMTDVLLVPGDRVEILVGPFAVDDAFSLDAGPADPSDAKEETRPLVRVRVGAAAESHARVPAVLRAIAPLALSNAAVTRTVVFTAQRNPADEVEFLINGETHHDDGPITVGELQVWDIVNDTQMAHPFHLHGFFFQVLTENGVAPAFRSWEDTYNVPAGCRIRIAWLADDRPGNWMYHCHILEHHAMGMMANFVVLRPGQQLADISAQAMGSCHVHEMAAPAKAPARAVSHSHVLARALALVLVTVLLQGCMLFMRPPKDLDYGRERTSAAGLYRGMILPEGDSIPQARLQKWTLHLETAAGVPVDTATITVDGGMPQHGHGLPTKPLVTRQLGNGDHLVEGMKFNMGGWWVVKFRVSGAQGSDSLVFNLKL